MMMMKMMTEWPDDNKNVWRYPETWGKVSPNRHIRHFAKEIEGIKVNPSTIELHNCEFVRVEQLEQRVEQLDKPSFITQAEVFTLFMIGLLYSFIIGLFVYMFTI